MIHLPDKDDIPFIRDQWIRHYGEAYTASHFDECLKEGDIYVLEEEGAIKASAASFCFPIVYRGKLLKTSFLLRPLSDEEEAIRKLEMAMIDMKSHTELMTLSDHGIEGFDLLSRRTLSVFERGPERGEDEITKDIPEEEMLKCYGSYMRYFDLYRLYSLKDMKEKKEREKAEGYQLISTMADKEYRGYCFYKEEEEKICVREMVYLDSFSLLSLLGYLFERGKPVEADTCEIETWNFLPEHAVKEGRKIYGKINDIELFNKLYMCSVHSTSEAFSLSGKCHNFTEVYGH